MTGRAGGRVAVVGAGIAGLGAAARLAGRGFEVVILERQRRAGGRVARRMHEGFSLEAGPGWLSTADRELLAWIEAEGLRDELLPLRPLLEAQARGGRVVDVETREWRGVVRTPGLGLRDALRLLRLRRLLDRYGASADPAHPEGAAGLDDRSLADFGRLYFGRSALESFLAPLVSAESPADARAASRVLFLHLYRRHVAGRLGLPRAPLAELPERAAARLGVRFGARVERVEAGPDGRCRLQVAVGEREQRLDADAVVVATDAVSAARIAAPALATPESAALARVRYAPALALAVGLRRPFFPHPRLVRVPHTEGSDVESLLFEPGVPGGRVPGGRGLATARASAAFCEAHSGAPDEALAKDLLAACERIAPGLAAAASFAELLRAPRGESLFDVGRYRDIAQLELVARDLRRSGRRLYLAGDYLGGPTCEAALGSGQRVAEAVGEDLSR